MCEILQYAGITDDVTAACLHPPGTFTGWNRQSGASLSGRVF